MLLDAYRFGVELRAPQTVADGAGAHGIAPAGALLVRPDGFVAWRSTARPPTPPPSWNAASSDLSRSRQRAARRGLGTTGEEPGWMGPTRGAGLGWRCCCWPPSWTSSTSRSC